MTTTSNPAAATADGASRTAILSHLATAKLGYGGSGVQPRPGVCTPLPASEARQRDWARQLAQTVPCDRHGAYQPYRPGPVGYGPVMAHVECPGCKRERQHATLMTEAEVPRLYRSASLDIWAIRSGIEKWRDLEPNCTDVQAGAWERDMRVALARCRDFCNDISGRLDRTDSGKSLLMLGSHGTGKTWASYAVERAWREAGFSAARLKHAEFLETYWAHDFGNKARYIKSLAACDLLIVDEFGRGSSSDSAQNAMFELMDARLLELRPTLIVSNHTREGLLAAMGPAVHERVRGSTVVNMTWPSGRGRA